MPQKTSPHWARTPLAWSVILTVSVAALGAAVWLIERQRERGVAAPETSAPSVVAREREASARNAAEEEVAQEPLSAAAQLFEEANQAFSQGLHRSALEKLYALHHSVQADIPARVISDSIGNVVNSFVSELREAGQTHRLLPLYEFLSSQEPDNTEYSYVKGITQLNMARIEEARDTLASLEYDPTFGERARELMREIDLRKSREEARGKRVTRYHARLRRYHQHFTVTAVLNGYHDLTLLIDTGASISTITPQAIERLGLSVAGSRPATFATAGGMVESATVEMRSLEIAEQRLSDITFGVLELDGMAEVDGLLGMNFLRHFRFFIDQEQGLLTLQPVSAKR